MYLCPKPVELQLPEACKWSRWNSNPEPTDYETTRLVAFSEVFHDFVPNDWMHMGRIGYKWHMRVLIIEDQQNCTLFAILASEPSHVDDLG
jgi:hypothetical protein